MRRYQFKILDRALTGVTQYLTAPELSDRLAASAATKLFIVPSRVSTGTTLSVQQQFSGDGVDWVDGVPPAVDAVAMTGGVPIVSGALNYWQLTRYAVTLGGPSPAATLQIWAVGVDLIGDGYQIRDRTLGRLVFDQYVAQGVPVVFSEGTEEDLGCPDSLGWVVAVENDTGFTKIAEVTLYESGDGENWVAKAGTPTLSVSAAAGQTALETWADYVTPSSGLLRFGVQVLESDDDLGARVKIWVTGHAG